MTRQYCIVQDEGRVRIVTLNRPEVLNALHADANDELAAVWDEFAARDDLWVGIITGAGERAFSAGNDLKVQAAGRRRPSGPNGFAGKTLPVKPAPLLGQHNAEVLADWLGLDDGKIGGLKTDAVIGG